MPRPKKSKITSANSTTLKVTPIEAKSLVNYFGELINAENHNVAKKRYEAVDQSYNLQRRLPKEEQALSRYKDFNIPMVAPSVESDVGYLVNTFLTGEPIFATVPAVGAEAAGSMIDATIEENARRKNWKRQLTMVLRDSVKYNFCAAEVEWTSETFNVPTNSIDPKELGVATLTPEIWSGNAITRLDPYNCFYDTSVALADVSEKGEYAGYVEQVSYIELARRLENMNANSRGYVDPKVVKEMWQSVPSESQYKYYYPDVLLNEDAAKADPTDFRDFVGSVPGVTSNSPNDKRPRARDYQVTTLYIRIVPSMWKLNWPQPDTVQSWKLVIVNGLHVIYFERLNYSHGNLPILFAEVLEDGLKSQTMGYAEQLVKVQDLGKQLLDRNFASLDRAISDRGVFDARYVNNDKINTRIPDAKIPIDRLPANKTLNDVYQPMPFNNNVSNDIFNMLNYLSTTNQYLTGQNRAQQGQFVKGNKTMEEFNTVMSNAEQKQYTRALSLEHQLFVPMKRMIKYNTLQLQRNTTINSPAQRKQVEVDPTIIRKADLEFKLADGLNPLSTLANLPAMEAGLNAISTNPILAQQLAPVIAPIFGRMMKLRGIDLQEFIAQAQQQPQPTPPPTGDDNDTA